MATWTYSAWRSQATTQAKLDMLRLHLQELEDAMANPQSVNSGGHGLTRFDLQQMIERLEAREASLSRGGGVTRVRKP